MRVNSLDFFNYQYLSVCGLISEKYWTYTPQFEITYYLKDTDKLFILQTFELFYQFYGVRPQFFSLKGFNRYQNFKLHLSFRMPYCYNFFDVLFAIRGSSKTKLIRFDFRESGILYLSIRDFITLYPFKIRFYDFHSWRNEVVIHANINFFTQVEFFGVINFFYSFYRQPAKR